MKILITDRVPAGIVRTFRARKDIEIDVMPELGSSPKELIRTIPEYDALIVRSQTKVTVEVLRAAQNLKVIGRAGVGYDNVDVDEATRAGILVMNTPEGNIISAAEHTVALMLALLRNIPQATASMKENRWEKKKFVGTELYGKTVGIVGFGKIGRLVAERLRPFGVILIAHDPYVTSEKAEELGVKLVSLDRLLAKSDIITLHTSLTKDAKHLIGRAAFTKIKKGAFVVNCSRGAVLDEEALREALEQGRVKGAALDVFETEPAKDNSLVVLSSVITTPHIAGSTKEAETNSTKAVITQVVDYLRDGRISNAVNIVGLEIQNFERVKPFLELAEKLGEIETRLSGGVPQEVHVTYRGDIADFGTRFITQALLKGVLAPVLGKEVNLVNALVLAKDRGIRITESTTKDSEDYQSLIELKTVREGTSHTLAGTILGKVHPLLVRVDEYRIEASPSSHMIFFKNLDKPGVVGKVGTILGRHSVNIASIHLSRVGSKGTAIAIVNVDSEVSQAALEELRRLEEMIEVAFVQF